MGDVLVELPDDRLPSSSHYRPLSPSPPSPPRVYAPIPKRRRGNGSSSEGSEVGDAPAPLAPALSPSLGHQILSLGIKPETEGQYEEGFVDLPEIVISSKEGLDDRESLRDEVLEDLVAPDDLDDSSATSLKTPSDSGIITHGRKTSEEHDCARDGCWTQGNNSNTFNVDDSDRLSDDYASRGGGKKRKVPASAQQGPSPGSMRDDGDGTHHGCNLEGVGEDGPDGEGHQHHSGCAHSRNGGDSSIRKVAREHPHRKMTAARKAVAFEKRLLQARTAQVLSLHSDALACISAQKQNVSTIPTKDELEELSSSLVYCGVTSWEGDQVGFGAGIWEGHAPKIKGKPTLGQVDELEKVPGSLKWKRRGRALTRWNWLHRSPIKRGGWIPEGSFEFEMSSPVSSASSKANSQLALLRLKVTHLITLTLSASPVSSVTSTTPTPPPATTKSKSATAKVASPGNGKSSRKSSAKVLSPSNEVTASHPPLASKSPNIVQSKASQVISGDPVKPPEMKVPNSADVTIEPTMDDPDFVPSGPGGKKKPKKKKRSALANAANPHHVKNYVPSRRPAAPAPEVPTLPDLLSYLFFPPPTRFLNARPSRNRGTEGKPDAPLYGSANAEITSDGGQPQAPDGAEEEYVCCFCEYDLFFGSDHLMDKGVRRRKKVLERRNKAEEKAKGVVDGKGLGLKSSKKKEKKVESECEGGDNCRCAEIRANRKAKKGSKKCDTPVNTTTAEHPVTVPSTLSTPPPNGKPGTKFEATVVGMADGSPLPPGAAPIGTTFMAELMGEVPEGKTFEEFAKECCLLPEVDSFDVDTQATTSINDATETRSIRPA